MKVAKNEILYIYDSDDLQQRQGIVYVKSLPHYQIRELDVRKDKLTQLQLSNLAGLLKLKAKDLIDDGKQEQVGDFDDHDLLDYLAANLFLIKTPIAVYDDHAEFIGSPFEYIKRDGTVSRLKAESAKKSTAPEN